MPAPPISMAYVSSIERIQLQIDPVSTNPNTPYLITHDIALAEGRGNAESGALNIAANRRPLEPADSLMIEPECSLNA